MGKAGKVRKRVKRTDPIRNQSNQPIKSDPKEDADTRQKTILPLIEKLSSATGQDRAMAIGAINALVENQRLRQMLLKEKLVQTVMTKTLTDTDEEVVSESYGLLRNLVVEEGPSLAVFLYRQDILSALRGNLSKWKLPETESNGNAATKANKEVALFGQMENMLGLISALAGSSEDIFLAINKQIENLPQILVELVTNTCQSSPKGEKSYCTATEALYVLSQDNPEFVEKIQSCPVNELLADKFPEISRVYINGLKFNAAVISGDKPDPDVLLEIEKSLTGLIASVDLTKVAQDMEPHINNDDPVDVKEINSITAEARSKVDQVQVAVEIIAAIAETLGEAAVGGEPHDEEMEDGEGDDDDDIHIDSDIDFGREYDESDEDPTVAYLHTSVLPLLVKCLKEELFESRVMAALNNVCWTLQHAIPIKSPNWRKNAEELWTNLLPMLDKSKDIETLNGIMGSLWAVARAFQGKVPISTEQARGIILLNKEVDTKQDGGEDYITRTIGLLGCVGKGCQNVETTQIVSDFILSIVTSPLEVHPLVLVEGLNALFDLFGDAGYSYDEPLFVKGGLLNILQQSSSKVRQAVKKIDKNKDQLLREQADEAALNLNRFIDYKKRERS